jgi:type VI secretion system protein ImpH
MDWDINLIVKKHHRPRFRLGVTPLGWTSWLSSKVPEQDDRQLLINPRTSSSSQGPVHG